MADLTLDGFFTKKQVEKRFGRHRRTISSDISGALATGDNELLQHCRVRTKDGVIQEGTALTPEALKKMVADGDNPTWYCSPQFVELVKQRTAGPRDDFDDDSPVANGSTTRGPDTDPDPQEERGRQEVTGLPPLPKDPAEQAALLKNLYLSARADLREERFRNEKIFALIETIPKQQEQTNVLLKNFQELMERNPSLALSSASAPAASPAPQQEQNDVERASVIEVSPERPLRSSPRTSTTKAPSSRTNRRTKSKTKGKEPQQTFTEKHLPTIRSWFSRSAS